MVNGLLSVQLPLISTAGYEPNEFQQVFRRRLFEFENYTAEGLPSGPYKTEVNIDGMASITILTTPLILTPLNLSVSTLTESLATAIATMQN